MKKYVIITMAIVPLIVLLLMKYKKGSDVNCTLKLLMEHYDADKVSLYEFYRDGDLPINLGVDYTHMRCIGESAKKNIKLLCDQQQSTQLSVIAEYLNILTTYGMYKQADIRKEKSSGIKATVESYGIKSVYSRFIYNNLGKPIGLITLNYNKKFVKIKDSDFEYYDTKCGEIGAIISE